MTPQNKARLVAAIGFAALLAHGTPSFAAVPPAATPAPFAQPSRFSVELVGSGPDVILVPGLSSPRAVWRATADRLKATHRVHLVQLRGFGEPAGANASGPVLQPFVDELAAYAARFGHPAIVGHSLGGLAALMVAEQHPDLPGRIVVVDALPFIGPLFGIDDVATAKARAAQIKATITAATARPDFAAPLDCKPGPAPAAPSAMSNSAEGQCLIAYGQRVSDPAVVGEAMIDDLTTDARPALATIRAPLTLIYPGGTPADPLYVGQYAPRKTATLVPIADTRHFVMQDQPEAFAKALDAALAR
ncbi:alpha/beta hydrolase [Sphingomonas sp. ASV193]|uniref:alpha/beta fold hydrolase n=1 Tax=Sphingomonas sp. ASV193 TaxID=3144405 RepID=UPI0032E8A277